jgi:hypothetical protein
MLEPWPTSSQRSILSSPGGETTFVTPPGPRGTSTVSTGGCRTASAAGSRKSTEKRHGASYVVALLEQGEKTGDSGLKDPQRFVSSRKADHSASHTGAYVYRTDGTILANSTVQALIDSGTRSTPLQKCKGYPRRKPCTESRMPGNWHVRFGERRVETSRRKAIWRYAPTLLVRLGELSIPKLNKAYRIPPARCAATGSPSRTAVVSPIR